MAQSGQESMRNATVPFAVLVLLASINASANAEFRKESVTKVEVGPSVVAGALPKNVVVGTINDSLHQAEHCFGFRKAMVRDSGEVSLSWTITPEGRASDIRVIDVAPEYLRTADCLRGRIRSWKFPESEGGTTEVRQGWSFRLEVVEVPLWPTFTCREARELMTSGPLGREEARRVMGSDPLGPEALDRDWVLEPIRGADGNLSISCHSGCNEFRWRGALQKGLFACGDVQAAPMKGKGFLMQEEGSAERNRAIGICYLKELLKNWELHGEIEISWSITAQGRISRPRVVRASEGLEKVAECAARAVESPAFGDMVGPADVVQLWRLRPAKD